MKQAHSLALEALSEQILKGIQAESMALYAEYERMCDTGERAARDGSFGHSLDLFTDDPSVPSGGKHG